MNYKLDSILSLRYTGILFFALGIILFFNFHTKVFFTYFLVVYCSFVVLKIGTFFLDWIDRKYLNKLFFDYFHKFFLLYTVVIVACIVSYVRLGLLSHYTLQKNINDLYVEASILRVEKNHTHNRYVIETSSIVSSENKRMLGDNYCDTELFDDKVKYVTPKILVNLFDKPKFNCKLRLRLSLSSQLLNDSNILLQGGETVILKGNMRILPNAILPKGYSYSKKAFFDKIFSLFNSVSEIQVVNKSNRHNNFLIKVRSYIKKDISKTDTLDKAGIMINFVTGERKYIPENVLTSIRNTGLSHLLAISGMHMSIIAIILFFFCRNSCLLLSDVAVRYDTKKIAALFVILATGLYLALVQFPISAVRAYVIILLVMLSFFLEKKVNIMSSLMLGAYMMLFIYPELLFSISFQLSYIASVILVFLFCVEHKDKNEDILKVVDMSRSPLYWRIIKSICKYFLLVLYINLIVRYISLPIIYYYFKKIALYSELCNLIAIPIIAFITFPLICLYLMLLPFGLTTWIVKLIVLSTDVIVNLANYVSSSLPNSVIYLGNLSVYFLLFFIITNYMILVLKNKKIFLYSVPIMLILLFSVGKVKVGDIVVSNDRKYVSYMNNDNQRILLVINGYASDYIRNKFVEYFATTQLKVIYYDKNKKNCEFFMDELNNNVKLIIVTDFSYKKCDNINQNLYDVTLKNKKQEQFLYLNLSRHKLYSDNYLLNDTNNLYHIINLKKQQNLIFFSANKKKIKVK